MEDKQRALLDMFEPLKKDLRHQVHLELISYALLLLYNAQFRKDSEITSCISSLHFSKYREKLLLNNAKWVISLSSQTRHRLLILLTIILDLFVLALFKVPDELLK